MLDTINLERRGIPAAVVGKDKLINTTGKGMARAQSYPSLSFAVYPYLANHHEGAATDEDLKCDATLVAPQVAHILTGRV